MVCSFVSEKDRETRRERNIEHESKTLDRVQKENRQKPKHELNKATRRNPRVFLSFSSPFLMNAASTLPNSSLFGREVSHCRSSLLRTSPPWRHSLSLQRCLLPLPQRHYSVPPVFLRSTFPDQRGRKSASALLSYSKQSDRQRRLVAVVRPFR